MKELGYHKGYRYAHDSPDGYLPQDYLPDQLRDALFYVPGALGQERTIAERLERWARVKRGDVPEGSSEA